jgi:2-hydroxy-6-oxonona-2,4-dienedioate hydrolase
MGAGWPATLESRWSEVGGRRFHALGAPGSGRRTVVVVHGLVAASRSVGPLLERLARLGFAAWAPDLPGFGLTDKPPWTLSVEELADSLEAWLDDFGSGPVHLLGNSFGSEVAVAVAERRPDLVDHLVLLGPTIEPRLRRLAMAVCPPLRREVGRPRRPPSRWARLATVVSGRAAAVALRLPRRQHGPGPSLATVTVVEWCCAGLLRAAGTVVAALNDPVERRLASVRAPTLVLRAERDHVIRPAWVAEMAARLPDGRSATLSGVGHSAQYHGAGAVARALQAFVEKGSR